MVVEKGGDTRSGGKTMLDEAAAGSLEMILAGNGRFS
jgi:hypothetical protein